MQTASANTPESAPAHLVQLSIPTPAGDANAEARRGIAAAQAFVVVDAESSIMAQETRALINTRIKTLTDARLALTRPIDAAKKVIMDFFNGPIGVLEQAKDILDDKVLAFDTEQENIRKDAQRQVEVKAAAERKRLQEEADERQRTADAAAQKLLNDAAALEAAGDSTGAAKLAAKAERTQESAAARVEVLQDRAAQVVAPIIQSAPARASGSSFRDNWKWRLTDINQVKDNFKMTVTNDPAISAIVTSQKGNAESIAAIVGAGIQVYNDRIIASRRA